MEQTKQAKELQAYIGRAGTINCRAFTEQLFTVAVKVTGACMVGADRWYTVEPIEGKGFTDVPADRVTLKTAREYAREIADGILFDLRCWDTDVMGSHVPLPLSFESLQSFYDCNEFVIEAFKNDGREWSFEDIEETNEITAKVDTLLQAYVDNLKSRIAKLSRSDIADIYNRQMPSIALGSQSYDELCEELLVDILEGQIKASEIGE